MTSEDGTYKLSWNVGKKLLLFAARVLLSSTLWQKPEITQILWNYPYVLNEDMWTNNEAGSEVLGDTIYRVIHDLWTLMREMISYIFVIKIVLTNIRPILDGYEGMAAWNLE